ncbi:NADPH-dependent ferric siderophore reductase [Isoptericola sp. CG 20/1183]|uniref:NADPH-dependent ferric siderophore reductase n=1 Tax=Isoptericola halotolerans TaxID=300560 RepID=A0ABX5EEY8_9MICO|nr:MULTISPECIES: siderophore-interacting protein [Isoptericola]PRZ07715.1 NADPH-dependent ferric siderophore reductase [Isoptericola halotolerans]PRZ07926.1 NADPH-dependent ferric siderophore reductase [Isoptericola sp. CG 20/1183]
MTRRTPHHATVSAVRWLTPHMVRLTLAGDALDAIDRPAATDLYIKLVVGEPPTPESRPVVRSYTVRSVRDGEWDVDFVVHGDDGLAGPWAARVRPGEQVAFLGPGGTYAPDLAAPWHLLVGDDAALPAIAAAVESLPAGTVAHAVVEVPGPADEQEIVTDADLHLTWVHRGTAGLADTVRAAHAAGRLPAGAPHAFLHGEASCVRELRRWVRAELGVGTERLSASGYWRRGDDDEAWRAAKPRWKAQVEQDDAELAAPRG